MEALLADLGLKTNLTALIVTLGLMVCRILPIVFQSPLLGGEVVPMEVRLGLSLVIALTLFPLVEPSIPQIPLASLELVALFAKELFLGFALAYISLLFDVAQMAGQLIDTFSGAGMAQVHVPSIGERVPLFTSLKVMLSVVVFLTINGHHLVIGAIGDSFATVPLHAFPHFARGSWAFFDLVIEAFAWAFPLAVTLAAPAMLATLLTDLALGVINRAAPQVQVFFISMSIKPLVAVMMVFVALEAILERMGAYLAHAQVWLRQAFIVLQ